MTRVVKRASNAQPTEQDKSTAQPDPTIPSHSESGDACIVQCVFKQMGMVSKIKERKL